jgi:hypothetical protein
VEAADEANTDFLRDSLEALDQASQPAGRAYVDTQRDPHLASQTHAQTYASRSRQETADDLSRRERLQRVLARLNRLNEPQAAASDNAYGDRTPSPNRQSLYDWAPVTEERNEDSDLDAILVELRRQQPETSPEILRLLGESQVRVGSDSPARAASYMRVNGTVESYEQMSERRRRERQQSLRNRAVLQRARQESSPSATERMLRYVMDRERSGMSEEEERARGSGWFRPTPRTGFDYEVAEDGENWLLPPMLNAQERDRQERVDAFRRGYLAEHAQVRLPRLATPAAAPASSTSLFLENALKYLSDLRSSRSYEDALATAIDNNLATKEFFADKHDDFVLDLDDIEQPPPSSWVQPGTIFEGHQHASSASMNITHHRHAQPNPHVEQINPNYRPTEHTNYSRIAFDASRPWLSHQIPPAPRAAVTNTKGPDPAHDHWPVRVTIHEIDWDKMTLQGTMEAYDVPQHPASTVNILNPTATSNSRPKAGKKHAPITTYLEGHILDHRTHSFLTPASPTPKRRVSNPTLADSISFPSATAHLDAQNWLALPPFNTLCQNNPPSSTSSTAAADTLARLLLSRTQLRELNEEYIFMRWKERCFVHTRHDCCKSSSSDRLGDQDRGHGLTISGFYYVSLRRSDGEVEGLYFDPSSTPYQLLRLKGRAGGWGSFELR